jgi:hypothetical protein
VKSCWNKISKYELERRDKNVEATINAHMPGLVTRVSYCKVYIQQTRYHKNRINPLPAH